MGLWLANTATLIRRALVLCVVLGLCTHAAHFHFHGEQEAGGCSAAAGHPCRGEDGGSDGTFTEQEDCQTCRLLAQVKVQPPPAPAPTHRLLAAPASTRLPPDQPPCPAPAEFRCRGPPAFF